MSFSSILGIIVSMFLPSTLLITLFLFMIGAILGSFLNVVIYRTINDEQWVTGRSRCDHCLKQIAWYDNIPLLSFLFLRGRCRYCGQPISINHPVVEFLTGSLLVWWYWGGLFFFRLSQHPFNTLQPAFWLLVGILLLIVVVVDALYLIIPDSVTAGLFILTLGYRLILTGLGVMQMKDLIIALVAMMALVLFFFSLWVITHKKGFGLGDVKLAGPLALLLGYPKVLVGMFLAFLIGAIYGVILIAMGKKKFGQVMPFGPFLVVGTVLALVWGEAIIRWYLGLLF